MINNYWSSLMYSRVIKILIIILIIINCTAITSFANNFGLTKDIYVDLCGVWDIRKMYNLETRYSWGKAKEIANSSVVIDLGDDKPFFFIGGMGKFLITKLSKDEKKYYIRIKFRDNNKYTIELSKQGDDIIIFHEMEWFKKIPLFGNRYGLNCKYFKLSGPTLKYYKPKVNNLRLRSKYSTNSDILSNLNKNDKLLIINKGSEDTIEGHKGNWVKVLTEKNEIGWCFDYYLEKL